MKLSRLLKSLTDETISIPADIKDVEISGISDDSRTIKSGNIFVAITGIHVDGVNFIPQAILAGAVVIIGEKSVNELKISSNVIYIQVKNSRNSLGLLASEWFDNPSSKLFIVGVTGTDGKTTTSSMIYHLLSESKIRIGMVTTVEAKIDGVSYDTGFHVTSPQPMLLQSFLAKMVEKGCTHAVLEVTSHGIDQGRFSSIHFDIAVLTNITHEHLDYHKNFESYRDTKFLLFKSAKMSILNADDPSCLLFSPRLLDKNVTSYSVKPGNADYCADNISYVNGQTLFNVKVDGSLHQLMINAVGRYNVANTLAAICVARKLNIGWDDIKKYAASFVLPIGRLEYVSNELGINIYIDFAHTPNALENVLSTLKSITKGKLIVVFGSAGERDVSKRPLMGEIAGKLADFSIVTAEDPRSENPDTIIQEIVSGITKNTNAKYQTNSERGEAIYEAIRKVAVKGDLVVICGKGHENSMCYGSKEYPWSDKKAVQYALEDKVLTIKR